MPRFLLSITALLLFSVSSLGQGIRMSPDFLPLEVGNAWDYQVRDLDGRLIDEFHMEITGHSIVDAVSYYVFTQFQLAPERTLPRPVAIRYDRSQRQFFHFDGGRLVELFPSLGASAEILENDAQGLPLKVRFNYGTMILTLERGLGIIAADLETIDGVRAVTLVGARFGSTVVFEADLGLPELAEASTSDSEAADADAGGVQNPTDPMALLYLEATPSSDGHRFVLRIRNTSEELLPFDFSSSQSYDFVVVEPDLGREVWRWSRRMFFSQVLRSEAIRPKGEWVFEAVWNYRDNNLNEVAPGTYLLLGALTAESPLEAGPIEIEVP